MLAFFDLARADPPPFAQRQRVVDVVAGALDRAVVNDAVGLHFVVSRIVGKNVFEDVRVVFSDGLRVPKLNLRRERIVLLGIDGYKKPGVAE